MPLHMLGKCSSKPTVSFEPFLIFPGAEVNTDSGSSLEQAQEFIVVTLGKRLSWGFLGFLSILSEQKEASA